MSQKGRTAEQSKHAQHTAHPTVQANHANINRNMQKQQRRQSVHQTISINSQKISKHISNGTKSCYFPAMRSVDLPQPLLLPLLIWSLISNDKDNVQVCTAGRSLSKSVQCLDEHRNLQNFIDPAFAARPPM